MSEVRIRPRQVLVLVIVFLIILLFVHRNSKLTCQGPKYLQAMYAKQLNEPLPIIYAITPTYARPTQKAELTRISHIFMLVPNLHWILVEDSNTTTNLVRSLIERAGLTQRSTQLNVKTPQKYELKNGANWRYPRGVSQRNAALSWIRANADRNKHSITFFMDDDNTYSVELFGEMNKIEKGRVGVWPVGLVGGVMVEKPLLNEDGTQVVGFNAVYRPKRPFPIDMAGFAISTDLFFKHSDAVFSFDVPRGEQETTILNHVTTREKLQPLANQCRDVLVWHTRTEQPKFLKEELAKPLDKRSNAGMEV